MCTKLNVTDKFRSCQRATTAFRFTVAVGIKMGVFPAIRAAYELDASDVDWLSNVCERFGSAFSSNFGCVAWMFTAFEKKEMQCSPLVVTRGSNLRAVEIKHLRL